MKFIKINADTYISVNQIQGFIINECDGAFCIQAGVDSPEPITIAQFDSRGEAQQYLAELVDKLNGGSSNHNSLIDKIAAARNLVDDALSNIMDIADSKKRWKVQTHYAHAINELDVFLNFLNSEDLQ